MARAASPVMRPDPFMLRLEAARFPGTVLVLFRATGFRTEDKGIAADWMSFRYRLHHLVAIEIRWFSNVKTHSLVLLRLRGQAEESMET